MNHAIRLAARLSAVSALLLGSAQAWAQVKVEDAWARATVPQQKSSGAYMRITSPQGAALVQVSSPAAGTVEIHEMSMSGDVMRMRAIEQLPLPAGKPVALEPGGYHVMLLDLNQQLKAGDKLPLTLVIEGKDKKRQRIEVQATVRPAGGGTPPAHAGH